MPDLRSRRKENLSRPRPLSVSVRFRELWDTQRLFDATDPLLQHGVITQRWANLPAWWFRFDHTESPINRRALLLDLGEESLHSIDAFMHRLLGLWWRAVGHVAWANARSMSRSTWLAGRP